MEFVIEPQRVCIEFDTIKEVYQEDSEIKKIEKLSNPPTLFDVTIQISSGPTWDYAQKKEVYMKGKKPGWPFVDWIKPQKVRFLLPPTFPDDPPLVTWQNDISHPNIIPFSSVDVCNNVIKENWEDNKNLALSIRACVTILKNPNPDLGYGGNQERDDALRITKKLGFPKDHLLERTPKKRSRLKLW